MWEYKNILNNTYIENTTGLFNILQYISDYGLTRQEEYLNGRATRQVIDKLRDIHIYEGLTDRLLFYANENIIINDELRDIIGELKKPTISYAINENYYTLSYFNKIENKKQESNFGKNKKITLSIINKYIKYLKKLD